MRKFVKVVTRIRKQLCHPITVISFSEHPMLVSLLNASRARTSHLAVKSFEPPHVLDWLWYDMLYDKGQMTWIHSRKTLISTFLVCKQWQALIYNYPLLWGHVIDYLLVVEQRKSTMWGNWPISRSKESTTMIGQAQINAKSYGMWNTSDDMQVTGTLSWFTALNTLTLSPISFLHSSSLQYFIFSWKGISAWRNSSLPCSVAVHAAEK